MIISKNLTLYFPYRKSEIFQMFILIFAVLKRKY